MAMDQNPALRIKGTKTKHKPTPHPTLRPLPPCQELRAHPADYRRLAGKREGGGVAVFSLIEQGQSSLKR